MPKAPVADRGLSIRPLRQHWWLVDDRLERQRVRPLGDFAARGDPEAVDRLGVLDEPAELLRARRATRHERVVRQHEEAALLDERVELEDPAVDDVARARDHARAGDP